ncbi:hypothetical protein DVH24_004965 [Malus domestica]|uniref:Uncharacterized protein n=1 Tax=Malus domestica TaxID=3750 RepID=A0A498IHR8_MALDO|nr:hypothetical protein DVH24_004965 [Malus domestica]
MLISLLLHNLMVFASHPSVGRYFSHFLVPYVFLGTNLFTFWLCDNLSRTDIGLPYNVSRTIIP